MGRQLGRVARVFFENRLKVQCRHIINFRKQFIFRSKNTGEPFLECLGVEQIASAYTSTCCLVGECRSDALFSSPDSSLPAFFLFEPVK